MSRTQVSTSRMFRAFVSTAIRSASCVCAAFMFANIMFMALAAPAGAADALSLLSLNPSTGDTAGFTSVTVTGSGLTGATWTWNDAALTGVVVADDGKSARFVTPAGADGAKGLLVARNGGVSSTPLTFTYAAVFKGQADVPLKTVQFDEIVNFRPVSAVNGSGDLTYAISPALPTGFTFVTSGDNAGYVTGSSSTESNGSFKVTITDGSGKSASAQFTLSVVAARPRVTSLSKSSAKASSGDKITATGVFPSSVISVTVNGVAASISGSPTSTSVDFVLPKVSRPGTVNVIVKTAKDGDSDPVSFTYTPDPMSAMALREKITLTNEVPISVPIPVIAVAGGSGLYSYSITGLSVGYVGFPNPFPNLRMTPDGKLFGSVAGGIPGTDFSDRITVIASDQNDPSKSASINIVIVAMAANEPKHDQSIDFTFPTPAEITKSGKLAISTSSGLPLTFSVTDTSICQLAASPNEASTYYVAYNKIGTCEVTATQAGDEHYNSATIKKSVAVTPPAMSAKVITNPTLAVNVSAPSVTPVIGSGGTAPLHYSYDVSTPLPNGLSIDRNSGALSGKPTATFSGSIRINVTDSSSPPQTKYDNFDLTVKSRPLSAAAAPTIPSLTVGTAFTPFTPVIGSGGTGTLTYEVATPLPSGLSFDTSSGQISGDPTPKQAFSGSIRVKVKTSDESSEAVFALVVSPPAVTPTVLLPVVTLTVGVAPPANTKPVSATGGNGTFSYASDPSTALTDLGLAFDSTGALINAPTKAVSNRRITVKVTSGVFSNTADFTLTVSQGTQKITFNPPAASATVNGVATLVATSSAGVGYPVKFSVPDANKAYCEVSGPQGATVTYKAVGDCVVNADQDGDANYAKAATVSQTLTVGPAAVNASVAQSSVILTVGVAPPPNTKPVSAGNGNGTFTYASDPVTALSDLGLAFDSSGALTGTPTKALSSPRTIAVKVTSGGAISTANFTLLVNKGTQTIDFTAPATPVTVDTTATLVASSSAGTAYPLKFSIPAGSAGVCSVSGTTVTYKATGDCVINADQVGDGNYKAAATVSRTVRVNPATLTVALSPGIPTLTVGTASRFTPVTGSGGTGTLSYVRLSGNLPGGLTLASDGALAGAPTASGVFTFTIQVSDQGTPQQTRTQDVTVTVNPSALSAVLSGAIPSLKVGVPVTPFMPVIASGGSGKYFYDLANGSSLPADLKLDRNTGLISGTPRAAGPISFAVTVSDASGSGPLFGAILLALVSNQQGGSTVPIPVLLQVEPGPQQTIISVQATPTAPRIGQKVVLTATMGASAATGTVTFKDGTSVIGSITLAGGKASVTSAALSAGTHSFTAVYSGDGVYATVTSDPVIITPTVRPNPTSDKNVRAMVAAQSAVPQRVALLQIDLVQRRLEVLHDEDVPAFVNGLSVSAPPSLPSAASPFDDPVLKGQGFSQADASKALDRTLDKNFGKFSAISPDKEAPSRRNSFGALEGSRFKVWTAGSVIFGGVNVSALGVETKTHFTLSGITAGVDTKLMDGVKGGFAVSFTGQSDDLGVDGSKLSSRTVTGQLYASWRMVDQLFLDGAFGYGDMSLSSNRFDATAANFLSGERRGKMLFGSLALSYDVKRGPLGFSPYGRLDVISANLNAYTETGDASLALSYDKATMSSQSLTLGLRGQYDLDQSWGVLSPTWRAEYRRLLSGALTQAMSYATEASTPYAMTTTASDRDSLSAALGLKVKSTGDMTGSLEYLLGGGLKGGLQGQGLRGMLRVGF